MPAIGGISPLSGGIGATMLNLTHEQFAKCLNQTFRISHQDKDHETQLIAVNKLGSADREGGREPFSLLFRGAGDLELPQGIYQVAHDDLEAGEIFLVPLGPGKEGMLYEAVFN